MPRQGTSRRPCIPHGETPRSRVHVVVGCFGATCPCPRQLQDCRAGVVGSTGKHGAVRSSAWIWLFSSTHSTMALSGGSRYSPTTSRTLSMNCGSVLSFQVSTISGAQTAWLKLRDEASRGIVASDVPLLEQFLHYWLEEIVEPNLAPKTTRNTRRSAACTSFRIWERNESTESRLRISGSGLTSSAGSASAALRNWMLCGQRKSVAAVQVQRVGGQLLRRETKTETSEAPLPLPDLCTAALKLRRQQRDADREQAGDAWTDSGLVFTTQRGTPIEPRNFNRHYAARCRKAKVR